MRVAYYPPDMEAQVGVLASSPKRAGFRVRFLDFQVKAADMRPLHQLTAD